nr:hypothetical protein [Tanacetum cinerariifolium]
MGHFARECRGHRNQDSRNRYQESSRRIVHVEETPPKAMVAIDGVGFDWSYMAEDEAPTNMALIAFPESKPEFQSHGPKFCKTESKNASKEIPNELKESPYAPLVKDRVSDNKDCSLESPVVVEKKTVFLLLLKLNLLDLNNKKNQERVVSRNNFTRVNYNNSTRKTHLNAHMNMAPREVLMKTGLRPLNIARPVNTAHPKTTVHSARPMSCFSKSAQSTVKRPYQQRTTLTNKSFSQTDNTSRARPVNTARPRLVNTAWPTPVNTAKPNSVVVNAVKDMLPLGDEQMMAELPIKELLKLVLLKVTRRNNIYNVVMNNIVSKESLTCLVAKATLDELVL